MILTVAPGTGLEAASALLPSAQVTDLASYIEYQAGAGIPELKADSPERYAVLAAEALRDLIVTSQISGADAVIRLCDDTASLPDCERMLREYCRAAE